MSLEILYIPVGALGLAMLLILLMKSPSSKSYQFNGLLHIHPPRLEERAEAKAPPASERAEPPVHQEEEPITLAVPEPEPPPSTDLEARMRFYQQEARQEELNEKEKSLDELQEEVRRASQQAKAQVEQNQRDLKNREYYLKQQEKLNSDKNKRRG